MTVPPVAPILEMRNVTKRFGDAQVLSDVSIEVRHGELHALVGQNGSGKSTLIKILAGYHAPERDASVLAHGDEVTLPLQPGQARRLRWSFVHQDLGLLPSLSSCENFFLYDFADRGLRRWHISRRQDRAEFRRVMDRLSLDLDPDVRVQDLSHVDRAELAVARAVREVTDVNTGETAKNGLLVLDEPTSALPLEGTQRLLRLLRSAVQSGLGVLLVSHSVAEVLECADRVTVLRDGVGLATLERDELSHDQLSELIAGTGGAASPARRAFAARLPIGDGAIGEDTDGGSAGPAACAFTVSGRRVHNVSAQLAPGEIVGLTGLSGSGFEEIPYLLYGAHSAKGTIRLGDNAEIDLTRQTPARALREGILLIPANRLELGLYGSVSVAENMVSARMNAFGRWRLRWRALHDHARDQIKAYQIRPPAPRKPLAELSGGNQQKVLLVKWLALGPRFLLLHEPVQGIDIGARREVAAAIGEVARRGTPVLCASDDAEFLASVCDRVLILVRGELAHSVERADADEITAAVLRSY